MHGHFTPLTGIEPADASLPRIYRTGVAVPVGKGEENRLFIAHIAFRCLQFPNLILAQIKFFELQYATLICNAPGLLLFRAYTRQHLLTFPKANSRDAVRMFNVLRRIDCEFHLTQTLFPVSKGRT